jgi:glyoxylase-like metal-dependent hydrolase (beta-lactamase superfamily II)
MSSKTRRFAALLAFWMLGAPASAETQTDALVASLVERRDQAIAHSNTLPVALVQRITAWQDAPLYLVLDERQDADPDSYSMTHPTFAFRWNTGRLLVIDPGLALDEAEEFGATTKLLGGGEMHCDPNAWSELLVPDVRIGAIVFSHLHADHTTGVRELCSASRTVAVQLSPEQRASDERYERQGREGLEAAVDTCLTFDPWAVEDSGEAVEALTSFPGVYRVAVPGHTPGSQLVIGFVQGEGRTPKGYVIAGDVINHRLGLDRDIDKPWWYRWFIVREDSEQQRVNRQLLRKLQSAGFEILINHDLRQPDVPLGSQGC